MRRSTAAILVVLGGCHSEPAPAEPAGPPPPGWVLHQAPASHPTAAYRWLETILEASARSVERFSPRPTILSREMAIAVTAMYDAWAAYDDRAVGTRLGGRLRRPPPERTLANREQAIAQAVHRALLFLYPEDRPWIDDQLRAAGGDPQAPEDPSTPAGVGRAAADAVIAYRRHDGSNQDGHEPGSAGPPYSDTTSYTPQNPTDHIVDPDRWQEIPFDDGRGGTIYPHFLTPHWHRVKPFALLRSDQFRPGPYPKVGTPQLKREVDEVIAFNGHLTLNDKAVVEFMRDGPRSTGQSGHWLRFSQDVSRRDSNDLDRDVKLFFSIANVVFDAFIACWEAKRFYDSSRPWTLVRHLYRGQKIEGYLGPCKGFALLPAEEWRPYSPSTFVTPPFPGYPSGHSTASGAGAKILEFFTGSDHYGAVARRRAGELTEAHCGVAQMQAREGRPPLDLPAGPEVELRLLTFSQTAEMAGISRVMGGYHIQADNGAGLSLGRTIAAYSWPIYQSYFDGSAKIRD